MGDAALAKIPKDVTGSQRPLKSLLGEGVSRRGADQREPRVAKYHIGRDGSVSHVS